MRDYNVSDPAIALYIEWLRNAMAPKPHRALNVPWYPRYTYWWFNDNLYYYVKLKDAIKSMDTGGWVWTTRKGDVVLCAGVTRYALKGMKLQPRVCFIPPLNDSVVRVGLVKLPFGAGLIVTAYQTGSGVTVVVHGTIINETEWKGLLARVGALMGFSFEYHGEYGKILSVKTDWVLWRIALKGHGSYLDLDGRRIPIRQVLVLLEMPAYWLYLGRYPIVDYEGIHGYQDVYVYWDRVEYVYWDIVGHPALSLAIRLTHSEDTNPLHLYNTYTVGLITDDVVLTWVKHPGNDVSSEYYRTPFLLRKDGRGVCNEQSRSTSLFTSNALGAYTAYLIVPDHAISLLMYPRETRNIDVNRDGEKEATIIVDTADLDYEYINKHIIKVVYGSPLIYTDPHEDGSERTRTLYGYFYAGVVDAVTSLPSWLKAPWLNYTMKVSGFERYVEEAWRSIGNYSYGFCLIDDVLRILDEAESNHTLTAPPSMALALSRVLDSIPVTYSAPTPELRHVKCVEAGNSNTIGNETSGTSNESNESTGTGEGEEQSRPETTPSINAAVMLVPVYEVAPTPWGDLPVFHHYTGSVVVNATNVTVIARPWSYSEYYVTVYVNGSRAYYTYDPIALPAELRFKHKSIKYVVRLETPEPPMLNETVNAVLEPLDNITYVLPNGTIINITMYQVNMTIKAGNTTIVVYGYVSRLGIDLDIYVYGVPPAEYNATIEGLDTETTVEYQGALHIYLHYETPQGQLIPEGTTIKITIQPPNLTIAVPVER